MGTTPRSIQSLLHAASPDIADVMGRVRFLRRIRAALLDILPPQVADHLEVAAYAHYRLRLHVGNAAWATRLRYMRPVISQALAQRMQLQIDDVEIRVRQYLAQSQHAARGPRHVSEASRTQIRRTARFIDDQALADALERLAAAGRRRE